MSKSFGNFEDINDQFHKYYSYDYSFSIDEDKTPGEEEEYNKYSSFSHEEPENTPGFLECDELEEEEKYHTELYFIIQNNINNNNTQQITTSNIEVIPRPKVFNIKKMKKEDKKNKKVLGRKRNSDKEKSENEEKKQHTKHSFDNISRKIRGKIFGAILVILNKAFNEDKEIDLDDPLFPRGKQRKRKIPVQNLSFLQIEQEIIIKTNVEENVNLLDKTLKEIFSANVSKKVKNYGLDYNKKLIQKINESKGKKRTKAILDMTFLQCLQHFRGSKEYEELNGLEIQYDNMIRELNENHEKDYVENFIECLNNYEVLYKNKNPKKNKHQSEISYKTDDDSINKLI